MPKIWKRIEVNRRKSWSGVSSENKYVIWNRKIFTVVLGKDLPLLVQLSKSSRAIFGGAYFSDVSGWKSIPISVPGPCEVTESYRLLGFCLTYSFILSHTFTLDQCRVSRRFNSISPKTAKMDFSSVKFWISFCAGLVSTITSVTNNDDNTSIKWVSEGFS